MDFDPSDPGFVADPYPVYATLRARPPVRWRDLWLVARHRDVDGLLRDPRLGRVFTPLEPAEVYRPWNLVNEHAMLEREPPDHTRLRRLVAGAFTARRVEGMRQRVRAVAQELVAPLVAAGGGDLVSALAEPLPVAVIAELLGVPAADRHRLRPWSNAIVGLYELEPGPGVAQRAVAAAAEFDDYLRALVARRRREPGGDLLSALATAPADDRLTDDELVATAVLLLNAGHEASVNVLAGGALALLRHPDQLARLRADPGLVPAAVEELIRYDTPLSLFTRTAFVPVEVGGVRVAAGERVGLLLGAANRDPDAFADPDRLDVGRSPNRHVGFGAVIHYCLGAPLARVELQEALATLLPLSINLLEDPPPRPTYQFRGPSRLPVRLAR